MGRSPVHKPTSNLRCGLLLVCLGCMSHALIASGYNQWRGHNILPQVGQAGTTVEVTLTAHHMADPLDIIVYEDPKKTITCAGFKRAKDAWDYRINKPRKPQKGEDVWKLKLKIAKNARLGEHQFRILAKDGLSELLTFWVTPYKVVPEMHAFDDNVRDAGRNDSPEHAQKLSLPCTVSGYLPSGPPQDHDFYKVSLKKGQRLTAEVVSARLGTHHDSGLTDAALEVTGPGPNGPRVARCDDTDLYAQDPVISFVAAADGEYFIHTRQQMDYETVVRHYLLHVGVFSRPTIFFPLGGPTGSKLKTIAMGDPLGKRIIEVTLPKEPGFVPIRTQAKGDAVQPEPNHLRAAAMANVIEGRDSQLTTHKGDLPIAFNGIIRKDGEVDQFQFSAKAGTRWRVRVFAAGLGSSLDSKISIRAAKGTDDTQVYEADDTSWEGLDKIGNALRHQVRDRLDSVMMFEPTVDGDYILSIEDTRRQSSEAHVYRVELQEHVERVMLTFPALPSLSLLVRDRLEFRPGNFSAYRISVVSGFGTRHKGPFTLKATGLPKGVKMHAGRINAGMTSIPVVFECAAKLKPAAGFCDFQVVADDNTTITSGFIANQPSTDRRGGYAMKFNLSRKAAWSILEPAAFSVTLGQPTTALPKNGEVSLPVTVKREPGFDGAVYLEMEWLLVNVQKQPPLIIEKGQTKGEYKLIARPNAANQTFHVAIVGREYNEAGSVRTGAGLTYVSSNLVELEIADPYLEVDVQRAAIERGKDGKIRCALVSKRKLPGPAKARLGRLPTGVTLIEPLPTIRPGDKEVVFKIRSTMDALEGQYKQIFCEVTIMEKGQQIRQQSGSGVLRVDPVRK